LTGGTKDSSLKLFLRGDNKIYGSRMTSQEAILKS
jgi:hypothetical protein